MENGNWKFQGNNTKYFSGPIRLFKKRYIKRYFDMYEKLIEEGHLSQYSEMNPSSPELSKQPPERPLPVGWTHFTDRGYSGSGQGQRQKKFSDLDFTLLCWPHSKRKSQTQSLLTRFLRFQRFSFILQSLSQEQGAHCSTESELKHYILSEQRMYLFFKNGHNNLSPEFWQALQEYLARAQTAAHIGLFITPFCFLPCNTQHFCMWVHLWPSYCQIAGNCFFSRRKLSRRH